MEEKETKELKIDKCLKELHDFFLAEEPRVFKSIKEYMEHRYGHVRDIVLKYYGDE